MCLIVIAAGVHPEVPLVVIANRDEYHRRASTPARPWRQAPQILAGRDLEAGGAWMGVTADGRFAAVTNVREPERHLDSAPSRGALVAGFLASELTPRQYIEDVRHGMDRLNGFNLIVGDRDGLLWCSNRAPEPRAPVSIGAGIHGLSNHLLGSPWPKVERTRGRLGQMLRNGRPTATGLLEILDDRLRAPDDELPRTGIGLEWERLLSPPRIVHTLYGTRCSTALLVAQDGAIEMVERGFDRDGWISWQNAYRTTGGKPCNGSPGWDEC